MRMNGKALCSFTLLIAAWPVWAARDYTVEWSVSEPTTIGNMEVKPAAADEVEVDSNKVTSVEFAGKTAALDFK
jgi:hypothetical protein